MHYRRARSQVHHHCDLKDNDKKATGFKSLLLNYWEINDTLKAFDDKQ